MTLPIDLRRAAVKFLFDHHVGSTVRWARTWYLGWDDVVKLQTLGHTVGGHGHDHEPYSRLTPPGRRQDANRVASLIRAGIGAGIRPFSYPYGDCDEDTATVCREAGFAHGFTTQRGWITCDRDPLRLPRVDTIDVDAVLDEEFACAQV